MSNAISPFKQSAALSLDSIAEGLNNSLMNAPVVENKQGVQYARMKGDDDWVVGKEADPIEDGDEFVVHPGMFTHGFVAWHGGRPEFKAMIPSNQPINSIQLPDPRTLKAKNGIEMARGMTFAGSSGNFVGTTIQYDVNSMGGREAIEGVMRAINEKLGLKDPEICPVITLQTTGYNHAEHGWITKPVFEIIDWMTLAEATELTADEEGDEEEVDEVPLTKAATKPAPEPEPEVEEAEVVEETPPTEGRRRRRKAA